MRLRLLMRLLVLLRLWLLVLLLMLVRLLRPGRAGPDGPGQERRGGWAEYVYAPHDFTSSVSTRAPIARRSRRPISKSCKHLARRMGPLPGAMPVPVRRVLATPAPAQRKKNPAAQAPPGLRRARNRYWSLPLASSATIRFAPYTSASAARMARTSTMTFRCPRSGR